MRGDEELLTIHSHLKGDSSHNEKHAHIEHANKMVVVSPLKREQCLSSSLSLSLFDDKKEKSVLKGLKINGTLNLDVSITERSVQMIMRLLIVETLHWEVNRVERTLKSGAFNEFR